MTLITFQRCLLYASVVAVILAIYPFTLDPSNDIKILIYRIGAFMSFALWLFMPRREHRTRLEIPLVVWLLAVFLSLMLVAAMNSVNVGYGEVREISKWAALCMLFVCTMEVFRTPKQIWNLAAVICLAVTVASCYGFVQRVGWDPFPWDDPIRLLRNAPATFGNPNFASHVLVLATLLALGLFARGTSRWAIVCVAVFVGHFYLTQTRGSIVALLGAILIVFVAVIVSLVIKSKERGIALTLSTVFLIGCVGVVGVFTAFYQITGTPLPKEKGQSIELRYNSFYGACRMIQDRPWLGYGPGMYQVGSPPYWTQVEHEQIDQLGKYNDHVHNEPLEIAVEAGLPASVIYVAILLLGVYYGLSLFFSAVEYETRLLGVTLAAFFFAFWVDGFFGFNVHVPASSVILFVVLGATAGLWQEHVRDSLRTVVRGPRFLTFRRIVVLGVAALVPIIAVCEFAAQRYQFRGLGATLHGEYDAARENFTKAAVLVPYDWLPPYRLGETAMKMGQHEKAIEHFERTLLLNPNDVFALFNMSQASFNLCATSPTDESRLLLDQAIRYSERAAALNPRFTKVLDLEGRAKFLQAKWVAGSDSVPSESKSIEQWREAEAALEQAIAAGSKEKYKLYNLIALAREARGDTFGAQQALVYAMEDNPGETEIWRHFEDFSAKSGNYHMMLTSLDRAITLSRRKKKDPQTLGILSASRANVLYIGFGNVPAAEAAYLNTVQEYPECEKAWTLFFSFAKSNGREKIFYENLMRLATQKEITKRMAPQAIAVALGLTGSVEGIVSGAVKLLETVAYQQETNTFGDKPSEKFLWAADILAERALESTFTAEQAGSVYFRLGLVYYACNGFERSVQMLDRALPQLTDTELMVATLRKAEALVKLGKSGIAVEVLERARARLPNSIEVQTALAYALKHDGQTVRARQELQLLLVAFPLDAALRQTIEKELIALKE